MEAAVTRMTTTADALELSALIYPTPAIPQARSARPGSLLATFGAAVMVLWLVATLAVMTDRWQPPVPAEITGAVVPAAMDQARSAR